MEQGNTTGVCDIRRGYYREKLAKIAFFRGFTRPEKCGGEIHPKPDENRCPRVGLDAKIIGTGFDWFLLKVSVYGFGRLGALKSPLHCSG